MDEDTTTAAFIEDTEGTIKFDWTRINLYAKALKLTDNQHFYCTTFPSVWLLILCYACL